MVTTGMAACLTQLTGRDGNGGGLKAVAAAAAAAALEVAGAAVFLGTGAAAALVWGDDPVSVALADLELTLGSGPAADAGSAGVVVLEPVLADAPVARWPGYIAEAGELGVHALFAFPLRMGAISVGVLVLHRGSIGALSRHGLEDALTFADAVTMALLAENEARLDAEADPDQVAEGSAATLGELVGHGAVLAQATGMVSVQLGVPLAEALTRLRAHAYGNNRPVGEVVKDVVARRLRFDESQR